MEEKKCADCKNFRRHYVKGKSGFRETNCGHCANTWPNGKFRKTVKTCEHFKEKEQKKDVPVTERLFKVQF